MHYTGAIDASIHRADECRSPLASDWMRRQVSVRGGERLSHSSTCSEHSRPGIPVLHGRTAAVCCPVAAVDAAAGFLSHLGSITAWRSARDLARPLARAESPPCDRTKQGYCRLARTQPN